MSLSNVSFTSARLVHGDSKQLLEVKDAIRMNAFELDETGQVKYPFEQKFDYSSAVHDGAFSNTSKTFLITTGKDAKKMDKFFKAEQTQRDVDLGVKRPGRMQRVLNFFKLKTAKAPAGDFYKKNISKYVKIPECNYSAQQVLIAVREGTFDFANLVIKTAK